MKLILASRNRGKLRELTALLGPRGVELVSLDDVGAGEVVEDADSFEGNAEKKARAALAATGLAAIGDDSGLEVDALGGAPGVRSARFAAPHDDAANNAKLLMVLDGVANQRRTARFRCVLVFVDGSGARLVTHGVCEGAIARAPRGQGGFGYDPLFEVEGQTGRTMAELSLEEKNRVSHRARALAAMANALATRGLIS